MKILVTGGCGFVGGHLLEEIFSSFSSEESSGTLHVVVLDDLTTGTLKFIHSFPHKVDFIKGSILDRDLVRKCVEGVDYVFHLAALISVPESMMDPLQYNRVNVEGTIILLEECARAGTVKKFVFSSSAAVYGTDPVVPKLESMPPMCLSPYAQTKMDGEFYVKMFDADGRVPGVCLRYFNIFGPRQRPDSAYAAAICKFVDASIRRDPITIFGDGGQTRDFVFVRDVTWANVHVALDPKIRGETYNVGYGKYISIKELAGMIIDGVEEECSILATNGSGFEQVRPIKDTKSVIMFDKPRPGDVYHSMADTSKLQATSWVPRSNVPDGLRTTIKSFIQTYWDENKKH
eukprot:TRINITY_DN1162_c0_g2_i1.p1 TRINITY_DN1162_c0_g2~~TRINITY_DN1162_c0_g2_i1.p1  ORF type:complete len:347 (-),score=91.63 TRINITY_DN1162_c0_g2_i1:98-1138(-)